MIEPLDETPSPVRPAPPAAPTISIDVVDTSETPGNPGEAAEGGSDAGSEPGPSASADRVGGRPGAQDAELAFLACGACRQLIAGRIVHAIGKRWHPDCFQCEHCSQLLEHVAFYENDGKPYCGVDYDDVRGPACLGEPYAY